MIANLLANFYYSEVESLNILTMPSNPTTNDKFNYNARAIATAIAIVAARQFLGACNKISPLCAGTATLLGRIWGVDAEAEVSMEAVGVSTEMVGVSTEMARVSTEAGNNCDIQWQVGHRKQYLKDMQSSSVYDVYKRSPISCHRINILAQNRADDIITHNDSVDINRMHDGILRGYEFEYRGGFSKGDNIGYSNGNSSGYSNGYERGRRDYEHDDTSMITAITILSIALAFSAAYIILKNYAPSIIHSGRNHCRSGIDAVRQRISNIIRQDNRVEEGRGDSKGVINVLPSTSTPLMVTTYLDHAEKEKVPESTVYFDASSV